MQAVLIIAHTGLEQVEQLCKLLNKRFEVYVHFDKKMNVPDGFFEQLEQAGIHCYSKTSVHWGGWSVSQVAIDLMREALKNPDITYFHLISGQDWPTRSLDEIYQYYENNSQSYIWCYNIDGKKNSGKPMIDLVKYYYNYDMVNRRSLFGKIYNRLLVGGEKLLRIDKLKRLKIDYDIYSGSEWVDVTRGAVEYAINYFDHSERFRKLMRTSCFSDEMWLPTILCNSPKYKSKIVPNNHRYIKWEPQNGSYPAILDLRDYNAIVNGDYQFARKFTFKYSDKLIAKLNEVDCND